jgi:hypothetical protein
VEGYAATMSSNASDSMPAKDGGDG